MSNDLVLFGLKGSTDWSVPSDWREVSAKFEAAMDVIEYCHQSFDRMDFLKVSDLGDVIQAIELVRAIPPQMRSARAQTLARSEKGRDVSSVTYRPKANAFNLLSLAMNPGATVAGLGLGIAARKVGRHVAANVMVDEEEWLTQALDRVNLMAVDLQTAKILTQSTMFSRDEEFDRELGRRVYWLGFVHPRPMNTVPANFVFDAATANDAIYRSHQELESQRRSFALLMSSPFSPGLTDMDQVEKKLNKGKNVPEMDKAWAWRRDSLAHLQRHVTGYARRMGWTGA